MFKKIRIAILLFILFLVGANAYLTHERTTDWDQSLSIVIYPINADGSVSDFVVSNAVNYDLEQAVINCIKETNGLWEPGKVNGFSSPMEKSIYVKFDVLGNAPFEEISASYYMTALKKYYQGQNIRNDHLLSMEKKEKKSERRFNSSLNCLKKATKFSPNDPTILHWQARNYEMLARYNEMRESLEQRQKLLSQSVINNQMIGNIELAIITK